MGWRPIKTAPKDGTLFDVWDTVSERRWTDCSYREMNWGWEINPFHGLGRFNRPVNLTHWRLPPNPPKPH